MSQAVFLDRDGVINRAIVREGKPFPPMTLAELEILPGVLVALRQLKSAGFLLLVATNQPDVARGTQKREVIEAMHAHLCRELPLDGFYTCYGDGDDCPERKPNPGLLLRAATEHGIDLSRSFMVGDRWRDIEAGQRAGCRTVFIDYGYRERRPERSDRIVQNLVEAALWIIENRERRAMSDPRSLKIKLFADGADRAGMLEMYRNPLIKGFTTNPTLMRKAGISDYEAFARQIAVDIPDRPLSFEVFSDELDEMAWQARRIARWGDQVYVKIPITNTRGDSTAMIQRDLSRDGIKLNVTAVFTMDQVRQVRDALDTKTPAILSIFAGRIADSGRDPMPMMADARRALANSPQIELLWASPRELLNLIQAEETGCDIITMPNALLGKLHLLGKDLTEFSLETVRMFRNDAVKAGFSLGAEPVRRAA